MDRLAGDPCTRFGAEHDSGAHEFVGLAARSAPQSNVLAVGLTIKLLVALLVTAVATPSRVRVWGELWAEHLRWIGGA